jgi:hypothetical protein
MGAFFSSNRPILQPLAIWHQQEKEAIKRLLKTASSY